RPIHHPNSAPLTDAAVVISAYHQTSSGCAMPRGINSTSGGIGKKEDSVNETTASPHEPYERNQSIIVSSHCEIMDVFLPELIDLHHLISSRPGKQDSSPQLDPWHYLLYKLPKYIRSACHILCLSPKRGGLDMDQDNFK